MLILKKLVRNIKINFKISFYIKINFNKPAFYNQRILLKKSYQRNESNFYLYQNKTLICEFHHKQNIKFLPRKMKFKRIIKSPSFKKIKNTYNKNEILLQLS